MNKNVLFKVGECKICFIEYFWLIVASYSSTFLLLLRQILKVLWKKLKGIEGAENGYYLGPMDESV